MVSMVTEVQETDIVTDDDEDIVADPDPVLDLEFDEEDEDDINMDDMEWGNRTSNVWMSQSVRINLKLSRLAMYGVVWVSLPFCRFFLHNAQFSRGFIYNVLGACLIKSKLKYVDWRLPTQITAI